MQRFYVILVVILLISCSSKQERADENESDKLTIAVVNYPLYYFAKFIGGDHVNVYLPSLGGDPAYWKPDARQVNHFQNADLILANGAGYAMWMEKVSLPSSKIVNTSLSFKNQWIETDEGMVHSHGQEGEHSHKGIASTTWLNFDFANQQASAIYESLVRLLPEMESELNSNYKKLERELMNLDARMDKLSDNLAGNYLVASHPVYQYLEDGYGINLISKHLEPDEMPTDEMWGSLEETINDQQKRIMIWEADPLQEIKSKLVEYNIIMTVFATCANKPDNGNFVSIMNENISQLEQQLTLK